MIYRRLVRPALFAATRHDPETAHELTIRQLAFISRHRRLLRLAKGVMGTGSQPARGRELFGLRFPSPVGLAAGYDKEGAALPALAALGFGFIEAGTITQHPQAGQSRPRIWRYPAEEGLVNAMGFPNQGALAAARLQASLPRPPVPVGWSISKSQSTAIDSMAEDVCASVRALHPYADYFVINVSSPNTPGLRGYQERARLSGLLSATQAELRSRSPAGGTVRLRPLLVKISPDLTPAEIEDIVDVCLANEVAGIVATNTSLRRRELLPNRTVCDRGGVSGRPLAPSSLAVVENLSRLLGGRLPIIGVGGIGSTESVRRMLDAGASLVQIYSALVFQGPLLVRRLNRGVLPGWQTEDDGLTAERPLPPTMHGSGRR